MADPLITIEWSPLLGILLTGLIGTASSVWCLSWWLSGQFNATRNLIYTQIEETKKLFVGKLDYHELHDDNRFQSLRNDIWDIRVRNAAIDGLAPLRSRDRDDIKEK